MRGRKPRSDAAKAEWRLIWRLALNNMPWIAKYKDSRWWRSNYNPRWVRRGRATALRMCLGYHVYTPYGRSNAQCALYLTIRNGSKPRSEGKQRMLKALAGPYGAVIARARLIQLGQADRFKYWPGA